MLFQNKDISIDDREKDNGIYNLDTSIQEFL